MSKIIFFFLHPKAISAAELGENGNAIPISTSGKSQGVCESVEDVEIFYKHFLSFYGIGSLSKLEASYFIIDAGASQEVRDQVLLKLSKCSRVSSLFVEQAIPFIVLGKESFTLSSSIDLSYNGESYHLTSNGLAVKGKSSEASSEDSKLLLIRDEDFFAIAQPTLLQASFLGDYQAKLRETESERAELRERLAALQKEKTMPLKEDQEKLVPLRENQEKAGALKEDQEKTVPLREDQEKTVPLKKKREKAVPLKKRKKEAVSKLLLSYVKFGLYEWLVLEQREDRVLLVTRDIVDESCFDEDTNRWEKSWIRRHLNKEFYKTSFTAEERKKIIETEVETESEKGMVTTLDNVFLLSVREIRHYFKSDKERICLFEGKASWYWLRSPGGTSDRAMSVKDDGSLSVGDGTIFDFGDAVYGDCGVRPAIWLKLGS